MMIGDGDGDGDGGVSSPQVGLIFAYYVTGNGFGHSSRVVELLLDCGAVQADALTVDRLASLEKYSQTAVVPRSSILATEVEWLKFIKANLVLAFHICRVCHDSWISLSINCLAARITGLGSDGLVKLVQEMQHCRSSQCRKQNLFGAKITGGGSGSSVCVNGRNCAHCNEEILEIQQRYKAATSYLAFHL